MADTRLTKINLWRKVYLCLLAVFLPNKFVTEEEMDNEERKNFPQPPPPEKPRIFIIRCAFWTSLFLVVLSGCIGYALGYAMALKIGCVDLYKITFLQIIGALFLLWGTLFVRGWEIQTFGGVTLTERVNRWIYRSMYCAGTAIIIFSLPLSSYPEDPYRNLSEKWIEMYELPLAGDNSSIGYSSEALFKSDIKLPDIEKFNIKLKFVKPREKVKDRLSLGYIANISIKNLDTNKIPEKYRKKREIFKGFSLDPLEEVTYEVHLTFDLFDKDGFKLIVLTSPKNSIVSGKINELQELAEGTVPIDLAKRTYSIKPRLSIDRCISCE
jgi:hypothetical protein